MITEGDTDLSSLSDSEIDDWLELAAGELSSTELGDAFDRAAVLLAAHLAKRAKSDTGDPGVETSRSEGDVSVSRAVGDVQSSYDTTSYGRRFQDVRDSNIVGPRSI